MEKRKFTPTQALRFVIVNQRYDAYLGPGTDDGTRFPDGMDEAWKIVGESGKEGFAKKMIGERMAAELARKRLSY